MKANNFLSNEHAQMGGMGGVAIGAALTLVVLGVLLYVGLDIMQGVDDSSSIESGDTFYNASTDITSGVETSFSLTGTLMLVIIAAAIISVLLMFAVVR